MNSKKNKSDLRWESGRYIHDNVLPSLQTPSQAAVVMFCWFHAKGQECVFDATYEQISHGTSISVRQAKRVIKELEEGGVIRTISRGRGRGVLARRIITGKPLAAEKGDTHDTLSNQKKVSPVSPIPPEKGDISDRKRCHTRQEKVTPMTPTQNRTGATPVSLRDGGTPGTSKLTTPAEPQTGDPAEQLIQASA